MPVTVRVARIVTISTHIGRTMLITLGFASLTLSAASLSAPP